MAKVKIGYQLRPQHGTVDQLIEAAQQAEALGADSIWNWDHMYPLYGDPEGASYEAYTVLGALARETKRVTLGSLVCCNTYRNPELLAYMTGTLDQLSHGRAVLGIGAGWFERDYQEYGYEFGTVASRLRELGEALPRIKSRLGKLKPQPIGPVPILIGGGGEKVTLRLVARYADMWNGFGPPEEFKRKNAILNQWCEKEGRDPAQIERTCLMVGENLQEEIERVDEYIAAGAQHLILGSGPPYDMEPFKRLTEKVKSDKVRVA
ncbi:MAG: LLM class F420-dependent oxidoreductase [Candidatus Dormibacteraceae bacterium]